MYSTLEVGFIAIIALLAGVAIGYLVLRRLTPKHGHDHAEAQLRRLREEHQNYRYQVTEHFSGTAEMLGQLANNYREIHNHLAQGAQSLCDAGAARALQGLPDDESLTPSSGKAGLEPPRDYALKDNPYEGTLDEAPASPREPYPEPPRY